MELFQPCCLFHDFTAFLRGEMALSIERAMQRLQSALSSSLGNNGRVMDGQILKLNIWLLCLQLKLKMPCQLTFYIMTYDSDNEEHTLTLLVTDEPIAQVWWCLLGKTLGQKKLTMVWNTLVTSRIQLPACLIIFLISPRLWHQSNPWA